MFIWIPQVHVLARLIWFCVSFFYVTSPIPFATSHIIGIETKNYHTKTGIMADEGRLQKMEVDYSSTVDERIPECEKLAKVCRE